MASTKTHDLAIKVGEYEVNGEKKGRYKNVGAIMQNEDGGTFVLFDATCLPMEIQYLANPKRQDKVIISAFEPRQNNDGGKAQGKGQQQQSGSKGRQISNNPDDRRPDFDDEIPF